ncbi:pseudouridine-5'-phosphate glycosidase [Endozoicomonas lisbonensis]|uniref:Pseudouridine-5'-phosphate glycosidase n=1 Tax=Endozoicomonas lisbonensis TaxID=3120522 RepID=A0ABV2SQM9_9GAMM
MPEHCLVHPEVAGALASGTPVVALESSLITNGFGAPANLAIAREQEQILRDAGVQPATTAVIRGRIKVGLMDEELEFLASGDASIHKASRRDLAYLQASALSTGTALSGGTTLAASMLIASMCGIRILATGGIGGVHRYAAQSFDISADLVELGRTPVAVVCAGAKSILDIPGTLEYLETMGVPVLGYQTGTVPAFYSSDSGCFVDYRLDSPGQAAEVIRQMESMKLDSGLVICNPIPKEFEIPAERLEPVIEQSISLARQKGISGKRVTPFLLRQLHQNKELNLVEANMALIRNNVRLAAQIACAL